MTIERVGVVSLAKIFGVLYGILGIFLGLFYALFLVMGASIGASLGEDIGIAGIGLAFGLGAFVFFPILYGIFGFIGGLITAALFNFATRIVGGLQVDVRGIAKSP